MDTRTTIEALIYRSCLTMDACDFDGYLSLCDASFNYAITTYSPEIRKQMTWLEHDRAGMKTLFANLPKHNSDHSILSRHVTVYLVEPMAEPGRHQVTSALQVFRTALDGGATELFAVGKMIDIVALDASGATLVARNVKLDTRMLGFGSHLPF